jgi:hypothetical protein
MYSLLTQRFLWLFEKPASAGCLYLDKRKIESEIGGESWELGSKKCLSSDSLLNYANNNVRMIVSLLVAVDSMNMCCDVLY